MDLDAAAKEIVIPALVGLIMFVVGLTLTLTDFRRVASYPKAVLAATLGQLILLPLIAFLLIYGLNPPDQVAAGMILLAASPAGGLSNFYAYLGRGNTALSVTLTAVSNLLSFVTLPVLAATGFAWLLDYRDAVELPVLETIRQLFLMMLLPIISGMLIRQRWPYVAEHWGPILGRMSLIVLAILVVGIMCLQWSQLDGGFIHLLVVATLFYLLAMAAGWATGKVAGLTGADAFVLILEFPARNLGITAVVGVMVLGRADFVLFATVLFLLQTSLLLAPVAARRLRHSRG